jgi:hypothetical protein
VVEILPHTNDGGPLVFPGKSSDLRQNEAWGTSSNHPSGHQVFGLDMGVVGWNGTSWSERFTGVQRSGTFVDVTTGETRDFFQREHYRIYGMPIHAMAAGTVCFALNDHEERATTAPSETISKSQGKFNGGGNQIFIKTGDEVALYGHFQPGSIPEELLQPGAPVRQGQYLGKVGLSGASSHPHVHIHVKKEAAGGAPNPGAAANSCDAGVFHPMAFKNLQSLSEAEANNLVPLRLLDGGDWTSLTNHSASHQYGLLYPSSAAYAFAYDAQDTKQYIGVWRAGGEIELRIKATGWPAFTKKWEELSNDNFRLIEINTFLDPTQLLHPDQRQFMGIFKRGSGNHALFSVAGWDAFTSQWNVLSKQGLRLIDMATYTEGATRFFAGVFREGTDNHALVSVTGWQAFTKSWDDNAKLNLRLVDVETHPLPGTTERQYIGVFRAGTDGHTLISLSGWNSFVNHWNDASKNGLRLMDVETFKVGNDRQFVGVFRQGNGGHALESATGYEKFVQACEKWHHEGLRLIDVHVEQ